MSARQLILIRAALTFVLAFMVAPLVHAQTATVNWVAPTQNDDGSAYTNPAGYVVSYGRTIAAADEKLTLANVRTALITDLTPGTWYFRVQTLAANNISSASSATVTKVVAADPPPVLKTKAGYAYCVTGTATAPTLTSIGYIAANLACGVTRVQGGITFCQIPIEQVDKVIFCPGDPTLGKGAWARTQ